MKRPHKILYLKQKQGLPATGVADVIAPILSGATVDSITTTTASGKVTTDHNQGTMAYVVTQSPSAPTATQVMAGQNHLGATALFTESRAVTVVGEQTFNLTGLTAGTSDYYIYFAHRDVGNNLSNVAGYGAWATNAEAGAGDGMLLESSDFLLLEDGDNLLLEGASESGADITAPILTLQDVDNIGFTTVDAIATTNEANGTLYLVMTTSATDPSVAQIKAGQDHTGAAAVYDDSRAISSIGQKTFNVTGLSSLTTYYAYWMHEDAAGNDSAIVSVDAWQTLGIEDSVLTWTSASTDATPTFSVVLPQGFGSPFDIQDGDDLYLQVSDTSDFSSALQPEVTLADVEDNPVTLECTTQLGNGTFYARVRIERGLQVSDYSNVETVTISVASSTDGLLLEDGDNLLLEIGDNLLLEGAPATSNLLLEDIDNLLLEDGDSLLLEAA
jgi:hypothetical protein